MMGLLRGWPVWVRSLFMVTVAAVSWVVRHSVYGATDSPVTRIAVSVCVIVLLVWVGLAHIRLLLQESEAEAERNPRPW